MTAGTAKVLVVDDEPRLRELLVDALDGLGAEITVAASGAEAISLAERMPMDLVVADLYLGDCTGLDVIDHLRKTHEDIPAVVITGSGDADSFSRASQCRPVELMTKPLDIDRLRNTVRDELARQADSDHLRRRNNRLRSLARGANRERKLMRCELDCTCADLTESYRTLSSQMAMQKAVLAYQAELLAAQTDDDVFRTLFRTFVRRSGSIFGVAMVCDANAQLNMVGRFGVPYPDQIPFCNHLTDPLIEAILAEPQCMLIEAGDEPEMFHEAIRRYLPGLTILLMPLIPAPGELIGLVALYRKGEQPFTETDIAFAELVVSPTAIAVRRND